jgi:putative addiction module component (TIGR02574 family)
VICDSNAGLPAARLWLMHARVDHLIDKALMLAPEERSAVVLALLDSLEGEDQTAVNAAWAEEIRRRKEQLRSGMENAAPWEQAKARLSAL